MHYYYVMRLVLCNENIHICLIHIILTSKQIFGPLKIYQKTLEEKEKIPLPAETSLEVPKTSTLSQKTLSASSS